MNWRRPTAKQTPHYIYSWLCWKLNDLFVGVCPDSKIVGHMHMKSARPHTHEYKLLLNVCNPMMVSVWRLCVATLSLMMHGVRLLNSAAFAADSRNSTEWARHDDLRYMGVVRVRDAMIRSSGGGCGARLDNDNRRCTHVKSQLLHGSSTAISSSTAKGLFWMKWICRMPIKNTRRWYGYGITRTHTHTQARVEIGKVWLTLRCKCICLAKSVFAASSPHAMRVCVCVLSYPRTTSTVCILAFMRFMNESFGNMWKALYARIIIFTCEYLCAMKSITFWDSILTDARIPIQLFNAQ